MSENRKPLTHTQRVELSEAFRHLANMVTCDQPEAISHVSKAIANLNRIVGSLNSISEFTEQEAELSRNIHRYIRKYEDTNIGIILYTLIDQNRGMPIWVRFVKQLYSGKSGPFALRAALTDYRDFTSDDSLMKCALAIWTEEEHFQELLNIVKSNI